MITSLTEMLELPTLVIWLHLQYYFETCKKISLVKSWIETMKSQHLFQNT